MRQGRLAAGTSMGESPAGGAAAVGSIPPSGQIRIVSRAVDLTRVIDEVEQEFRMKNKNQRLLIEGRAPESHARRVFAPQPVGNGAERGEDTPHAKASPGAATQA